MKKTKAYITFVVLNIFTNRIFRWVLKFNFIESNLKNQIILWLIGIFIDIMIIKIIEKVYKLE